HCMLFLEPSSHHLFLHSFPTRRSSDLDLDSTLEGRFVEDGRQHAVIGRDKPVLAGLGREAAPRRADAGIDDDEENGGGGKIFIADRKSTRLNSSHVKISYAVFCLKKKK